jgi:hypothetical protein
LALLVEARWQAAARSCAASWWATASAGPGWAAEAAWGLTILIWTSCWATTLLPNCHFFRSEMVVVTDLYFLCFDKNIDC